MQLGYGSVAHRGELRVAPIIKGTHRFLSVRIGVYEQSLIIKYINAEVENIKLVCKKNVDDSSYIFKLELAEERNKEDPAVVVLKVFNDKYYTYQFHITPELTRNIIAGKYWLTLEYTLNGQNVASYPSIVEIMDNGADTSGGQVYIFGDLEDGEEMEF